MIRHILAAAALAALAAPATAAFADGPQQTEFVGISWLIADAGPAADDVGYSLKLLASDAPVAGTLGMTLFQDGAVGCSFGVAYNFGGLTMTSGYDICQHGFEFGIGESATVAAPAADRIPGPPAKPQV